MIDGLPWRFPELRGGAFARGVPQTAPREWSPRAIGEILHRHGVISGPEGDYAAVPEVWWVHSILVSYQLLLARHHSLQAEAANRRRAIAKRLGVITGQVNALTAEAQGLAQEYERLGPRLGRAGDPNSIRPLDGAPDLGLFTREIPELTARASLLAARVDKHARGYPARARSGPKGRPWEFKVLANKLRTFFLAVTGQKEVKLTYHSESAGGQVLTGVGAFVAEVINSLIAEPGAPITADDLRGL